MGGVARVLGRGVEAPASSVVSGIIEGMNVADVVGVEVRVKCSACNGTGRTSQPMVLGLHPKCCACVDGSVRTVITVPQFRAFLLEIAKPPKPPKPGVESIIAMVANYFGLEARDLVGKSHAAQCVLARHLASWLCYTHLNVSYPDLGRAFHRDHTTILHAVRKIDEARRELPPRGLLDSRADVKAHLGHLEQMLEAAAAASSAA